MRTYCIGMCEMHIQKHSSSITEDISIQSGISHVPRGVLEACQNHLRMVIETNKSLNLTRIDTFEEGMLLHVEDSLTALPLFESAPEGWYLDMGTGAGFPGIPLALATKRKTVLVDARKKKVKVLNDFLQQLQIGDYVSAISERIEALPSMYKDKFAVITARALSQTSVLMEFATPLLLRGGWLICYKAQMAQQETDHLASVANTLGLTQIFSSKFLLSDNQTQRTLLVFQKTHKASIKLPRLNGYAQKHPL